MLPQQSWAEQIFAPEVYCSVPRETNIFTTNNGPCEARLYLRGEEDIIGLHYDDVLGNTFHYSMKAMAQEKNGFAYRGHSEDMRLVVISSGRLVINASNGSTYMRWGIHVDEPDLARVKTMLEAVLSSFPEFKNPAYPMHKFHEYLMDHMQCG